MQTGVRQDGAYRAVEAALAAQRCVILDGGVATELPHVHDQDHERLWGIEALTSAPGDVLDVHRRYVDAGADIITTNTWSLPTLTRADLLPGRGEAPSSHWMELARRGVDLARQAIDDGGRSGEVAVAFSLNGDLDGPDGLETATLLARTLAAAPPDVLLLETLSVLRPSLFTLAEALLTTGLPLWLSFRRCPQGLCGVYGQHWGGPEGDAFGRAARRFEELGVGALLVNCIPPDHVAGMITALRDFTDLPLGVYPNLGYHTSDGWQTEREVGPDAYAALTLGWREEGAQIVGGCCGTTPEHIASAAAVLADTTPGHRRHVTPAPREPAAPAPEPPAWTTRRGRPLAPLPFPRMICHPGVRPAIGGTLLLWRHLFEQRAGAHQRCLDIGSGAGLQAVQLALNGAAHVHAIDADERAVANTKDNAFRNDVADRVTAQVADVYPWLPDERYELVVANLPQIPVDPADQPAGHRPPDYWGRGLLDQVLAKLPRALAAEGRALVLHTSLLSHGQTTDLLARIGLTATVVAWDVQPAGPELGEHRRHIATLAARGGGALLDLGGEDVVVNCLLDVRHASGEAAAGDAAPWQALP